MFLFLVRRFHPDAKLMPIRRICAICDFEEIPDITVRKSGRNHEQIVVSTAELLCCLSEKSISQQTPCCPRTICMALLCLCSFDDRWWAGIRGGRRLPGHGTCCRSVDSRRKAGNIL